MSLRKTVMTQLLHAAARAGNARLVRYLINQGADCPHGLRVANEAGRGDVVLELLLSSAQP